jgi:hypothetical protein
MENDALNDPKQFMRHAAALLQPERLWTRSEVLERPCPTPRGPGLYVWYFRRLPPRVPAANCHTHNGLILLYTGISPRQPPVSGAPASKQSLLTRVRYHFRGNAEGSTLRLTLGCLLAEELGIELCRVGSGRRMTFGGDGEAKLSAWLGENAFVAWLVHPEPWKLEEHLISTLSFPLNLDQNRAHAFHRELTQVRIEAKARARSLPVAV